MYDSLVRCYHMSFHHSSVSHEPLACSTVSCNVLLLVDLYSMKRMLSPYPTRTSNAYGYPIMPLNARQQ